MVKNPTKVGTSVTYTDNTYSSLQAVKFDTVTGVPQVGEEIKQVLTVSPKQEKFQLDILHHMILKLKY